MSRRVNKHGLAMGNFPACSDTAMDSPHSLCNALALEKARFCEWYSSLLVSCVCVCANASPPFHPPKRINCMKVNVSVLSQLLKDLPYTRHQGGGCIRLIKAVPRVPALALHHRFVSLPFQGRVTLHSITLRVM